MTFEEWFNKEGSKFLKRLTLAKAAWDAASEDTKEAVTVEWSELVEDWSVRDFRGAAIEDGFMSKEAAQSWAEFKGYKVE